MNYNNMPYSIKRSYLGNKYYSCNKYKVNKCPAKLIVRHDGTVIPKNHHTCVNDNLYKQIDVREEMMRYCVTAVRAMPATL